MQRIDATAAQAEDILVWLGRHLPAGADVGTPKIIIGTGKGSVLTADGATTALISLADDSASATRMAGLPGGLIEITSWSYGVETVRRLIALDDEGDGGDGDDDPEPEPSDDPLPGGSDDPEFRELVPVRVVRGDTSG